MRWVIYLWLCPFALLLAGCGDNTAPLAPSRALASMVTFRYDAARDVVVAQTSTLAYQDPLTAQRYAEALAMLDNTSYAPTTTLRLANPTPTVSDGVLTVNYRDVAGLEQLSSAQTTAILAALEAWWWVPEIRELRVQANGQPLTTLGPITLTQPLRRAYHTYIYHPQTGEVAYLVGSLTPANLSEAIAIINRREIREFPATQGFLPLLPPNVTMTPAIDKIVRGILPVDLSANFPRQDSARLAGLVLMLTQFPQAGAVQFTFGGESVKMDFMRSTLDAPLSSQQLLLPPIVAQSANRATQEALQATVQETLGRVPASYGSALVWRDWATVPVVPQAGATARMVLLQQQAQGYQVVLSDVTQAGQPLRSVPSEVIIAFRLFGWEALARNDPDQDK